MAFPPPAAPHHGSTRIDDLGLLSGWFGLIDFHGWIFFVPLSHKDDGVNGCVKIQNREKDAGGLKSSHLNLLGAPNAQQMPLDSGQ